MEVSSIGFIHTVGTEAASEGRLVLSPSTTTILHSKNLSYRITTVAQLPKWVPSISLSTPNNHRLFPFFFFFSSFAIFQQIFRFMAILWGCEIRLYNIFFLGFLCTKYFLRGFQCQDYMKTWDLVFQIVGQNPMENNWCLLTKLRNPIHVTFLRSYPWCWWYLIWLKLMFCYKHTVAPTINLIM